MRKSALSKHLSNLRRPRITTPIVPPAAPTPSLLVETKTFLSNLYREIDTLSLRDAKEKVATHSSTYQSLHFLRVLESLEYNREWKQAIDFVLEENGASSSSTEIIDNVNSLQRRMSAFTEEKKKEGRRRLLVQADLKQAVLLSKECERIYPSPNGKNTKITSDEEWEMQLSPLTVNGTAFLIWLKTLALDPTNSEWSVKEWRQKISNPPTPVHAPPLEELEALFFPINSPLPLPPNTLRTFCIEFSGYPNFISNVFQFQQRHFLDGFENVQEPPLPSSVQRISYWEKRIKDTIGQSLEDWLQGNKMNKNKNDGNNNINNNLLEEEKGGEEEEEEEEEEVEVEEESEGHIDTMTDRTLYTYTKNNKGGRMFYSIRDVAPFPWKQFFSLSMEEREACIHKLHTSSLFSIENFLSRSSSSTPRRMLSMDGDEPLRKRITTLTPTTPMMIASFALPSRIKHQVLEMALQTRPWIPHYLYTSFRIKNKEELASDVLERLETLKDSTGPPHSYIMNPFLLSLCVKSLSSSDEEDTLHYRQSGRTLYVGDLQLLLSHHLSTGEILPQQVSTFQSELKFLESVLEGYRQNHVSYKDFIQSTRSFLARPLCTLPEWWKDKLLETLRSELGKAMEDQIFYDMQNKPIEMVSRMIDDMFHIWLCHPNPLVATLGGFLDRVCEVLLLTENYSPLFSWGSVFRKRMRGFVYHLPSLLGNKVTLIDLVPRVFTKLSTSQRLHFMERWESAKEKRVNALLFSTYPLFFPGRRTVTHGSTPPSWWVDMPSPTEVEEFAFQWFVVPLKKQKADDTEYVIIPTSSLVIAASLFDGDEEDEGQTWSWLATGSTGEVKEVIWSVRDMQRFVQVYRTDLLVELDNSSPHVVQTRATLYQGYMVMLPSTTTTGVRIDRRRDQEDEEEKEEAQESTIIPEFFDKVWQRASLLLEQTS